MSEKQEEKTKADDILVKLADLENQYKKGLIDIQTALTTLAAVKPPEPPKIDVGKLGQHQTIEEVADCPTCKAKLIEKYRPEILKEQREKLKSMKHPVLCEDCGDVVDKEKERDCPTCHGKHF